MTGRRLEFLRIPLLDHKTNGDVSRYYHAGFGALHYGTEPWYSTTALGRLWPNGLNAAQPQVGCEPKLINASLILNGRDGPGDDDRDDCRRVPFVVTGLVSAAFVPGTFSTGGCPDPAPDTDRQNR